MQERYRLQLPAYTQPLRQLMPELVAILEQGLQGQAYGFAFFEESLEKTVFVGRMESSGSNVDRGMILRLVSGGRNYEAATNNLEPANLKQLATALNRQVKAAGDSDFFPVYEPRSWAAEDLSSLCRETASQIPLGADKDTQVHFGVWLTENPLQVNPEQLMERGRSLRNSVIDRDLAYSGEQQLEPLALVYVSFRLRIFNHIFVDRCKNMSQSLPISVSVVQGQTVAGKSGRTILGGMGGLEVIRFGEADFREVVEIPHKLDTAILLKPGTYQVITGPDITGVFAHEAFGHTQEGDTCRQGRSITAQLQGDRVGNAQATIVNNAAVFSMGQQDYGTNGSYFFDHEGELARENIILDQGHLMPPMTDLLTSLHLGIRRTASGKRESWRRPTLTRQTNTYFTPGDKTLAGLLAMVKGTGFLATVAHGGMEDPKGANLTAGANYFEEIVDGRLTGRLFIGPKGGHIELSGYVPELLQGIVAKTKIDYETGQPDNRRIPENKIGGCGKFHKEYVQAGCGGPFILWAGVTCG